MLHDANDSSSAFIFYVAQRVKSMKSIGGRMNYFKRVFRSIFYHKRNVILLFVVFLILSTLILSGLCIRAASDKSAEQIRQNIGGTITMTNDYLTSDKLNGTNAIPLEKVNKIAEFSQVKSANVGVVTGAFPLNFTAVFFDEQKTEFAELPSLFVYGDTSTVLNSNFSKGNIELDSGRLITADDKKKVVISKALAVANSLSISDNIILKSAYTDSEVKLEIIGLFTSIEQSDYTDEPYNNYENQIFTDINTVLALNGNDYVNYAIFSVNDPVKIDEIVEMAEALPRMGEWDGVTKYTKNNSDYRKMAEALNGMNGTTMIMVVASIIMGAVILTLLTVISLKERDFEIGVLLSMGEIKWKIVTQLILESLIPVLLAVTGAVFISSIAAQEIGNMIGASDMTVVVDSSSILLMYLCGVALTLIASSVTVYKVVFYQPKKILMAME